MRIVYLGASDIGWHCCKALLEDGHQVVGILSIPRRFRISWAKGEIENVRHRSFEDLAAQYKIPLLYMTTKMADPIYKIFISELRPDLLVVIGWYYVIPKNILKIPPLGTVGIHASLLPKYRGGAPLVWAIINGEQETGVTLFYFDEGVDDGDIIAQKRFPILLEDTIADVIEKARIASVELVREFIPRIAQGTAPRIPQDHEKATYVPQRRPQDGLLRCEEKTAMEAYNWIRAQSRPYPGAFIVVGGRKIKLGRAFPGFRPCKEKVGKVYQDKDGLWICCKDKKAVLVTEWEEIEDSQVEYERV